MHLKVDNIFKATVFIFAINASEKKTHKYNTDKETFNII